MIDSAKVDETLVFMANLPPQTPFPKMSVECISKSFRPFLFLLKIYFACRISAYIICYAYIGLLIVTIQNKRKLEKEKNQENTKTYKTNT